MSYLIIRYYNILSADIIILEISSIKTVYHTEDDLYFNIDLYNRVIGSSENLKNNQRSLKKLYNQSENIQKNTIINSQTEFQLKEDLVQIYKFLVCVLNKKLVLSNLKNFYESKGSDESFEILFRVLKAINIISGPSYFQLTSRPIRLEIFDIFTGS